MTEKKKKIPHTPFCSQCQACFVVMMNGRSRATWFCPVLTLQRFKSRDIINLKNNTVWPLTYHVTPSLWRAGEWTAVNWTKTRRAVRRGGARQQRLMGVGGWNLFCRLSETAEVWTQATVTLRLSCWLYNGSETAAGWASHEAALMLCWSCRDRQAPVYLQFNSQH